MVSPFEVYSGQERIETKITKRNAATYFPRKVSEPLMQEGRKVWHHFLSLVPPVGLKMLQTENTAISVDTCLRGAVPW